MMRGRRSWFPAALLVVLLPWPAAAGAQQVVATADLRPWLGRTITTVLVEAEGQPLEEPALNALLAVHVGVPLTEADVTESLVHIRSLGRYETVTVAVRSGGEGVTLVFSLVLRHPIDQLEFRGTLGLDRRALERSVLEQAGGRLASIRVAEAAAAVERLLADEGFFRPVVTPSLETTHTVHRATLVFDVEAGPRRRIGRITVTGDSPLSASDIISAARITPGAPYRRRALEDALRGVAEELRARRYYEASAGHFPTGDGQIVDLTLNVEAGPIVDIVVSGDPLPDGGVDQWVPIRRENSADDDLLEDSAFRIRSALQRDGYWRAQVDIQRVEQPQADRVVVTVSVSRGRRFRLTAVNISGQSYFSEAEVRERLALHTGNPFREDELYARVQALISAYAASGYSASVDVIPEAVPLPQADQEGGVVVHLTIVEGVARSVAEVVITGTDAVPEAEVLRAIRTRAGQPLRDAQVRQDRSSIESMYRDAGFLSVSVTANLADGPDFTLTFEIVEGPQTFVDHVIVVGNQRVATDTILNQVTLRPGQPFGQAARAESQRRLNELAIFRRVNISPAQGGGDAHRVDVIVQVEEAPATTVGYGGGLEVGRHLRTVDDGFEDRFEFAPRGFLELGRRNLFGGNRSINVLSRVSLGPKDDPDDPLRDGTGFGLSEYRVTTSYREARAWRSNTDVVVSATAERAIRTSFTFVRRAVNAEALRRVSSRMSVFGRYALDSTRLFNTRISAEDQPLIDRLFPQIRLSSLSSGVVWDNRDDVLDPTSGGWLSADVEVAAQSLGSEVGFVKTFLQATGFRRITRANRVVLAGRVQVGLARGFERQVIRVDALVRPMLGPDGEPLTDTVADLPAGRRFFSGGSTSVRGYQQDRLGVPGILNAAGLSNGGNGLVVLNGEVRTLVLPAVSLVGFIDGGNVFSRAGDISPGEFRGAMGIGVRYRSPLGPLRLDFGFKLDRRIVSGKRERGWEFHLSIGEAF